MENVSVLNALRSCVAHNTFPCLTHSRLIVEFGAINMNIHVFLNAGQEVLFDKYFYQTIQDDWIVVPHQSPVPEACNYGTLRYMSINLDKIARLISEIIPSEMENPFFILSDIDIQFFCKCDEIITAAMDGRDMVFQNEQGRDCRDVNGGFIAMRPTENVLKFWKRIEADLHLAYSVRRFSGVQPLVNKLLSSTNDIQWALFPSSLWAWSNADIRPSLPSICQIRMHHANCTIAGGSKSSLDLKLEQLELVRRMYTSGCAHANSPDSV